ncbi:peptidoglycan-associated lipoprotein Pal [Brevundimonas variabilis]|uniref:Peptidoglycan-associated lipoprotein n=1 Tax=Brevundimonas variabilis TaxID=74312 RepID=A0A7W9CGD8_9CAUL|nr:peptidoglycan-associated lipoprotein Pal [Brevundimonas variabilis]MBB5744722.1 peptidoglycan-associated lipoprotein [Brevundimonas variabilis]
MIAARTLIRLTAVGLVVASMAACTRRPVTPAVPNTPPASDTGGPAYPTAPTGPIEGNAGGAAAAGSAQEFAINVGDRIYFDLDSYQVSPDAYPRLNAQAEWLQRYPQVMVRIEGNADERGTREYNLALAARRAESVRNYLIERGVSAGRIDTISFGKERPIALGSSEDSWARNRNGRTALVSGAY